MDVSAYQEFLRFCTLGLKKQARDAVRRFIDSFESVAEREAWTRKMFEAEDRDGLSRYELRVEVVLPALIAARERGEPWATMAMVSCGPDHTTPELWERAGKPTVVSLLLEELALRPDHAEARTMLLSHHCRWLQRCFHEWPAGVLYGMDGASLAELDEIDETIAETAALDDTGRAADFLAECRAMAAEYRLRLARRSG